MTGTLASHKGLRSWGKVKIHENGHRPAAAPAGEPANARSGEGALGARPMPPRVVPDTRRGHLTGLDMAPEDCGPALHDGTCRAADVGRQGMGAFIVGIGPTEDVLQGNESHSPRIARTDADVLLRNICANHPRAARLVQRWR